ncbi:MAG: hypothetical protein ACLRYR_00710 [Bifidobacterium dentium]
MYRLYNRHSGEHFYTGSANERDGLRRAGWRWEGAGLGRPTSSGTPVVSSIQSLRRGPSFHGEFTRTRRFGICRMDR